MTKDQIKNVKDLIEEVGFDRFEDNIIRLIGSTDDIDKDIDMAIIKYLYIHSKLLDDINTVYK